MAGPSAGVYKMHSVIRGHHIYKTVWTSLIDETVQVHGAGIDINKHDEYAVDNRLYSHHQRMMNYWAHIKRDIKNMLVFLNA